MGKSLQDQLLSLGLAKKEAGRKPAEKSARKNSRPARQKPAAGRHAPDSGKSTVRSDEEIALARAYALREQEEKRQVEQAKKKKQEEDRRRRELNKALKAIVNEHRLNDASAEVARNFMYKGRIRKINLTPDQLRKLNEGELGVVYLLGGYHLLPAAQVEAVRRLSDEHVPDLSGSAEDDDEEFPVPDDLIW